MTLGEHFSVLEGEQRSPVEKFVLKLYLFFFLMGGMRLIGFQGPGSLLRHIQLSINMEIVVMSR